MKRLGFITSEEDPNLTEDDLMTVKAFAHAGWEVVPVVWDREPKAPAVDALIFRSCWNYHRKTADFLRWIKALEMSKTPIFNSLSSTRWNLHKSYLLELKKRGVLIPETVVIKKNESVSTAQMETIKSSQLVLKPAVSLNGENTFLVPRDETEFLEKKIQELTQNGDLLIQEFIPQVQRTGEISFVYFNGQYSHAVQKKPREGEFRIHTEYGGSRVAIDPAPSLIDQATKILNCVPETLLFARVDVIEVDSKLVLIELEIVDPTLFFKCSEKAANQFVDGFIQQIQSTRYQR